MAHIRLSSLAERALYALLRHEEGMSVRDVIRAVDEPRPIVLDTLRELERQGYVELHPYPNYTWHAIMRQWRAPGAGSAAMDAFAQEVYHALGGRDEHRVGQGQHD